MIVYFKRSSNDFSDILFDTNFKNNIDLKISWLEHLMVKFSDNMPKEIHSYINIKYGDDIVDKSQIVPDRTPIPYKDYQPLPVGKEKILRVLKS